MTVFAAGDPCMLYDTKGRQYLIELITGREFHYHRGVLSHDAIIGTEDGTTHESSLGAKLVTLRPRLADYTLKMTRGAAVVYPKDTGEILVWADIAPGMTVLEAGTGSGALAMALTRAVGPGGRVVSVEVRDDHAKKAAKLIRGFFGEIPQELELRQGSVEEHIADVAPGRIVLDLPEPWHSVPAAAEHLTSGGIFCCYLPTVPQVQTVRDALSAEPAFFDASTFEVLRREWAVDGRSVRPSHRMIGHTGFITTARRITP
jgi:tRNA (adenine57-N1/adenine58-N1)-methyltransferase